jgi:hypothetical protein
MIQKWSLGMIFWLMEDIEFNDYMYVFTVDWLRQSSVLLVQPVFCFKQGLCWWLICFGKHRFKWFNLEEEKSFNQADFFNKN